jgi:hypothetical protein
MLRDSRDRAIYLICCGEKSVPAANGTGLRCTLTAFTLAKSRADVNETITDKSFQLSRLGDNKSRSCTREMVT